MQCKYCGQELPAEPTGRRPREYCNNAHRQAHYRKSHQIAAPVADQSAEVTRLARELAEAKERIEELETQVMRLHNRLDVERRYLENRDAWSFKAWLRKQPSTPFRVRFLSDEIIPPRASRGMYQAQLRRLQYSAEEQEEFTDLWKLMLMQS